MPRRNDIKSILIIGSGPIIIGQACEFDYAGVQACKALKEEEFQVILVNSNPATIMTDPDLADSTYIEPIHWSTLEKVIDTERPDAILTTMGGQTGLNCALDLNRHGILDQYNVEMIGANQSAIEKAEGRNLFRQSMAKINLETVRGKIVHSLTGAHDVLKEIGFPAIIRPSFTLGGTGGGIAYNKKQFKEICQKGLEISPATELLIEESILGWKEYEMEVVRDKNDNCIVVCSIENVDPMGVHTGDSITVAPAQTLSDKEYQMMRDASIAVLREIGVDTGGSNVQFAINPDNGKMIVIEMNPRVSRSSALASKATGFPIAKVAAKLSVGFTLEELKNDITGGKIPASFEPSIDYIVTKIPRFNFEKFSQSESTLTTQMKSVGEVMAIGRTFQESLQKALRGLEIGSDGLDTQLLTLDDEFNYSVLSEKLKIPGVHRIWYLGEAFRYGMSVDCIYNISKIDAWFLSEIEELIEIESDIEKTTIMKVNPRVLRIWKQKGFSDKRLARLMSTTENEVRNLRTKYAIHPVFKRVDSCSAEFDTSTAYMYSTYEEECESYPTSNKKIIILGGGPNRIGQGIEFDYCCVHAAIALKDDGYETIMINCNPETVSTDYDISDRLYFESLTLEDVLEIVRIENPLGIIVQYGGQTPLKLSKELQSLGAKIIGTSPDSIHQAEDRGSFQEFLSHLRLTQLPNRIALDKSQARALAEEIGYPLIVRPSYVLGGKAMGIVHNLEDLNTYISSAVGVSFNSPVLLERFVDEAIELDVDAVCDGKEVIIGGIMEHIEEAGVHSGDSACSLPPFSVSDSIQNELRSQTKIIALALNVIGLINVQFAVKKNKIYVLEVNPRASRTIPFVSKATGRQLAKIASLCMVGRSLSSQCITKEVKPPFYSVKEAVFPFISFPGVDTVLGPEMKSTGEVMGISNTFGGAFNKSQKASGYILPQSGKILFSLRSEDRNQAVEIARYFSEEGFKLYGTDETAKVLSDRGLPILSFNTKKDGYGHLIEWIKHDKFQLIFNTVSISQNLKDSYQIRRQALFNKVPCYTTLAAVKAVLEAYKESSSSISIIKIQTLHKLLN